MYDKQIKHPQALLRKKEKEGDCFHVVSYVEQ